MKGNLNKKMENSITKANNTITKSGKPKFSEFITSKGIKASINNTLQSETATANFIGNMITVVNKNPIISDCDPVSVIGAGLQAEKLHLSLSPELGYAYLIPFNDKKHGRKLAVFMLGYRGYIQMAMRTNQYRNIGVHEVYEGEYAGKDKFGEACFNWLDNTEGKEVIGYVAYFEMLNGFTKSVYWSKEKIINHAKKYSRTYDSSDGLWKNSFDKMAKKTLIRDLLHNWGMVSADYLNDAYKADQASIDLEGNKDYVDNPQNDEDDVEIDFTQSIVGATETTEEESATEEVTDLFGRTIK